MIFDSSFSSENTFRGEIELGTSRDEFGSFLTGDGVIVNPSSLSGDEDATIFSCSYVFEEFTSLNIDANFIF